MSTEAPRNIGPEEGRTRPRQAGARAAMLEARPLTDECYALAECPVWDARTALLYWADIDSGLILAGRFTAAGRLEETRRFRFDAPVGSFGLAEDGGLIVATGRRIATVDPAGQIHLGPELVTGEARRFNDGSCDPAGRFLVGTLSHPSQGDDPRETLLSMQPDGTTRVLRDGVALSNGIAWSPDGTVIYHADTLAGRVWAARYDAGNGNASGWRVHLQVDDGLPDGITVDAGGALWVAIWGRGQVRRYAPDGTVLQTVTADAPLTSCPALAGPDRDLLVVTTARSDLTARQAAEHPLSGALFGARVAQAGQAENLWRGDTTHPFWQE